MKKISGVRISESEYEIPNTTNKGKIAVLMYHGSGDPKKILDLAVSVYVKNKRFSRINRCTFG